ncbi:hypothetical protein, partial [Mesorhizobium sp. M8A.F.Ca.ET.165.01.1.1]|uniref:hypothetical protein n=1 Tax=Mesorhizobium sp. M8A.F.Ca.ET.165.01.1.1 TaxID=2563960 RepID=UPI0016729863
QLGDANEFHPRVHFSHNFWMISLAMQQENIMSSLRGPIAGIDGILIGTAIDETSNDMSDTQSMRRFNFAFRIP